ncbi:MAG: hypothetical protein WKG00_18080 [Polyangiaceae bacterium]
MIGRRAFFGVCAAALGALAGGGSPPPARGGGAAAPKLPPLKRPESLSGLCAAAGLRWLVEVRPREIASTAFLIPAIGKVVSEARFDAFTRVTGIDLRQATQAVAAAYGTDTGTGADTDADTGTGTGTGAETVAGAGAETVAGAGAGGETMLYLVRHAGDAQRVERAFADRLTAEQKRVADRPDLVRITGVAGNSKEGLAMIGADTVALQRGGSRGRGPMRVATLYAEGKLKRSPSALAEPTLRALSERLGPAPVRAFARGPFEGELARGARGLLEGTTGIGAAARPSAREGIALAVALVGDFGKSSEEASRALLDAWNDVAYGTFGKLLALDRPVTEPLVTHAPGAVALAVELDPNKLAEGLYAATSARIEAIMR